MRNQTFKALINTSDLARVAKVFDRTRRFLEDFSLFMKVLLDM